MLMTSAENQEYRVHIADKTIHNEIDKELPFPSKEDKYSRELL